MLDIAECALAALKLVSLLFGFIEGGARQCLGPMEIASSSVISVVKKKKKKSNQKCFLVAAVSLFFYSMLSNGLIFFFLKFSAF